MPKLLSFLFCLQIAFYSLSQKQLKQFVKESTVQIATIQPDATNFSDLEAIGNAIGDASIVMLGEQDHGDAPVFLAKTRLIKYLHEKKGFNVLAFESDFFGLNEGWDQLPKQRNLIDSFLQKNIFPIWTDCSSCSQLFYDYIPNSYKTANPIAVTGFDNQMVLNYTYHHIAKKLDSVMGSLNLPISKQSDYSTVVIPAIDSLLHCYFQPKDALFHINCAQYLEQIKQQASLKLDKNDFWMMVINNLIQENFQFQTAKSNYFQSFNARDLQMAKNLHWLAGVKFPNEKIIVWAANGHVGKYSVIPKAFPSTSLARMGHYFVRDSMAAKKTYTVGFTSYQGNAGRLGFKHFEVRKPKTNGFENWVDKSYEYAFTNFKSFTGKAEPFYLKALDHNTFFEFDWTQVFDGIFFIRNMYACKR